MFRLLNKLNSKPAVLYTVTNKINNRQFLWKASSFENVKENHHNDFLIQQYYLNDLLTYDMYIYGFENFEFHIYAQYDKIDPFELDKKLTKLLMSEEYVYNNTSPIFYNDFSLIRRRNEFYFYEGLNYLKIWNNIKESSDYKLEKEYRDKWFVLAKEYNLYTGNLTLPLINSVNAVLEVNDLEDFKNKYKLKES